MTLAVSAAAAGAPAGAFQGVLCALMGQLCFATGDTLVKVLTQRYSIFQIIPLQVTFACVPILLILWWESGLRIARPVHPRLVALRGLLAGLGTVFGFYAFAELPLAEVYAMTFCVPIVVTVLAIPVLGEVVGPHRWAAVLLGFLGILVMVQPGFRELSLGHLAAAATVLTGAGVVLILRKISRQEQRSTMVFSVIAGMLVMSLPVAGFVALPMRPVDLLLAAGAGLAMAGAQLLMLQAFRQASAASVAPTQYTMMVWALLFGALVFGDPAQPPVLIGAAIVTSSSLYILHREFRRAVVPPQAVTPAPAGVGAVPG